MDEMMGLTDIATCMLSEARAKDCRHDLASLFRQPVYVYRATDEELVTHYFSHPHCPKENAFAERKIQTDECELWAFEEG